MTNLTLASLRDTQLLARRVAAALRVGDSVLLRGDVGTGKTTFAQYLIAALAAPAVEVTSPTFTLVQDYAVTLMDGVQVTVWHYDLYRIEQPSALEELGMDEAADTSVRVIEWPERLPETMYMPSWMALHFTLENGVRRVAISSGGAACERLMVAA